jgi:uncharacterized surface protein with fasciclin (FAS1) repeats
VEKLTSIKGSHNTLLYYNRVFMKYFNLFTFATTVFGQSILDVVLESKEHTVLASLVATLPSIVKLLDGQGHMTLFAPNDDAFATLDNSTIHAVTSDAALLEKVLFYHVILDTAFDPEAAPAKSFPETASGEKVAVTVADTVSVEFGLGNSTVLDSVSASNGIVHIVDTVLIPPSSASNTLKSAGLNELVKALSLASLNDTVDGINGATIFAPTDAAFQALFDTGIKITPDLLVQVLKLHVLPDVVFSTDIVSASDPFYTKSISNQPVYVKFENANVTVCGEGSTQAATVVESDILYDNGVVHIIDSVLLPK